MPRSSPLVSPLARGTFDSASRDEVAAYQLNALREYVQFIARSSAYWREKFRRAGVIPADIRTLDDFRRLPTTDKAEQAQILDTAGEQEFGGLLARPLAEIKGEGAVIWRTTGTTGRQRSFITSTAEFERTSAANAARVLAMGGVHRGETFGILAPVNFWVAGLSFHLACRMMSVTPLLLGPPFDTLAKLEILREYRPEGVFLTPTFAFRVVEVAREQRIDLTGLGTRVVILGGEVTTAECRRTVHQAWRPADGVRDAGGLSETMGFLFCDCEAEDGMHVFEDRAHADVMQSDNPSVAVDSSEVGELVITAFMQREMISAFRFRTNDLVRASDERCRCGRSYRRLYFVGRKDDMRTVGGVNVFPGSVEAVIRNQDSLSGEFRLATSPRHEFLRLRAEASPEVQPASYAALAARLNQQLRIALGINVRIEIVPFASMPRFEGKARRWEEF